MGFWFSPLGTMLMLAWYLLPIGAAIWALVTLSQLRAGQADLLARLMKIEHRLREKP